MFHNYTIKTVGYETLKRRTNLAKHIHMRRRSNIDAVGMDAWYCFIYYVLDEFENELFYCHTQHFTANMFPLLADNHAVTILVKVFLFTVSLIQLSTNLLA